MSARLAIMLFAALLSACASRTPPPAPVVRPPIVFAPSQDFSPEAQDVLFRALGLVGTPYRWGGNTPDSGFDCSGLIAYVYRDMAGISLPRTTREMISMQAANVGKEGLQTGDLIFFATNGGSQVSHAGIYVGEGRFVHAPATGGTVKLDSLSKAYWQRAYLSAKRGDAMTARTLNLDDSLYQYLLDVSLRETPLLKRLRDETQALPMARWQVAPEQGQFLALLVKLIGARRVLEVGTFTGYSALCMAAALPTDGSLICCDIPGDYNAIAHRYWQEAGLSGRIDLRLAPALETLGALNQPGQFDLIFIDADKANYPAYLEQALRLLRSGGLAVFDNTLWSGRVLEYNPDSADTRAIQALNRALKDDARVDLSLLPKAPC
eukprot:gene9014-8823_t